MLIFRIRSETLGKLFGVSTIGGNLERAKDRRGRNGVKIIRSSTTTPKNDEP
jgi:hypothetical protein